MAHFGDRLSAAEEALRDRILGPVVTLLIPRWITPNHLTVLRAVLVGLAMIMYLLDAPLQRQVAVLVIAALTDCFDGIIARARNQISRTGAYLDHGADWFLGSWVGILALISGLLPVVFIVFIVIPQIGIVIADRIRAARIDAEKISQRVLIIAMGAANFRPTAFARFQFFTVLTGLFLLLISKTWPAPALRSIGLSFLYITAGLSWILLMDIIYRLIKGETPTDRNNC